MQINGYAVEPAPNGAWWVRPAQGRHAWRFADRSAALYFVRQLRPPRPRTRGPRRRSGAAPRRPSGGARSEELWARCRWCGRSLCGCCRRGSGYGGGVARTARP